MRGRAILRTSGHEQWTRVTAPAFLTSQVIRARVFHSSQPDDPRARGRLPLSWGTMRLPYLVHLAYALFRSAAYDATVGRVGMRRAVLVLLAVAAVVVGGAGG